MAIVYQLINPPQDVTDALNALQTACAGWHKTPVEEHAPSLNELNEKVLSVPVPPPPATATESMACQFIADPIGYEMHDFEVVLVILGFAALMVGILVWGLGLHRIPGWIVRQVRIMRFMRNQPTALEQTRRQQHVGMAERLLRSHDESH